MYRNSQDVLLGGLYNEWINNLHAYTGQLDALEMNIQQLLFTAIYGDNEAFLGRLLSDTTHTKDRMQQVLTEVETAAHQFITADGDNLHITVGEMMLRNRLRDKIRKLEQTTFILKYRLNQYLSKAS
jgi:hypothetical protein